MGWFTENWKMLALLIVLILFIAHTALAMDMKRKYKEGDITEDDLNYLLWIGLIVLILEVIVFGMVAWNLWRIIQGGTAKYSFKFRQM